MSKKLLPLAFALLSIASPSHAGPEQAPVAVWVNEAIVATYSFSHNNYLADQQQIAKYFTSEAWINYSKALTASKLPEAVQKNLYSVSAVATNTPVITQTDPTHWKATMDILVIYQNPQYKQRQNLKVTVGVTTAQPGLGVRGLSLTSLQSKVISPPCQCPLENADAPPIP